MKKMLVLAILKKWKLSLTRSDHIYRLLVQYFNIFHAFSKKIRLIRNGKDLYGSRLTATNNKTVGDKYPIATVEDMLDLVERAQYFI